MEMNDFYEAIESGGAWFCATDSSFDTLQRSPMYDTQEEAQDAADEMNGLWHANGTPANAAARAKVCA